MAKDSDQAESFENGNTGGLLTGFFAEETEFDRPALWRLGSWAAASAGAVIVALLANTSSVGWRREQVAAADLARQSQQIQAVAKESQNETRRLAAAIDTLNSDRDRLYSRVTVLEQGLDAVTSSIVHPAAASAPSAPAPPSAAAQAQAALQSPVPPPVVAPVATVVSAATEKPQAAADTAGPHRGPNSGPNVVSSPGANPGANTGPSPVPGPVTSPAPNQAPGAPPAVSVGPPASTPTPLMASKSMMAPPDAAASKLIEPERPAAKATAPPATETLASVPPAPAADQVGPEASPAAAPATAVRRTEFAVDVGAANSVGGLRALWRGLVKSNAPLATLQPIIMVKESSTGLGMQLRLAAGPLDDAAAAAKICAALTENQLPCETTVFDGQRLAVNADEPPAADKPAAASSKPAPPSPKPSAHKRGSAKHETHETSDEPAKKPEFSSLSTWFSRH